MEQSQKLNVPRDNLSREDAIRIQSLATRIIFAVADCGPTKISCIDGVKNESTRIAGFQARKAREVVKDIIENFLLRGY